MFRRGPCRNRSVNEHANYYTGVEDLAFSFRRGFVSELQLRFSSELVSKIWVIALGRGRSPYLALALVVHGWLGADSRYGSFSTTLVSLGRSASSLE